MKKVIGYLILLGLAAAGTYMLISIAGVEIVLKSFGITVSITTLLFFGLYLIMDDHQKTK